MELVKFTAMKIYTAIIWGVTVLVLNAVTTVLKQFTLCVFKGLY
jgi:hypothetical protein